MKKVNNPLQTKNEKVLALYQAVIDLIEEGTDINSVKVIDITNRAGIGKGTAYEYFNSKEEMIVEALQHDMFMQMQDLKQRMQGNQTMQELIYVVLNWMEHKFTTRRSGVQFFRISYHSYEIRESFHREFEKAREGCGNLYEILLPIIEKGKAQKQIEESLPLTLCYMVLISHFVSFFMGLNHMDKIADVTLEQMKDFVLCSIMKSLT